MISIVSARDDTDHGRSARYENNTRSSENLSIPWYDRNCANRDPVLAYAIPITKNAIPAVSE